jgi:hypothetical protein
MTETTLEFIRNVFINSRDYLRDATGLLEKKAKLHFYNEEDDTYTEVNYDFVINSIIEGVWLQYNTPSEDLT